MQAVLVACPAPAQGSNGSNAGHATGKAARIRNVFLAMAEVRIVIEEANRMITGRAMTAAYILECMSKNHKAPTCLMIAFKGMSSEDMKNLMFYEQHGRFAYKGECDA